jgi:hypothetical protein
MLLMGRFRTERREAATLKEGETLIRDEVLFTVDEVCTDGEDTTVDAIPEGQTETTRFYFGDGQTVVVLEEV